MARWLDYLFNLWSLPTYNLNLPNSIKNGKSWNKIMPNTSGENKQMWAHRIPTNNVFNVILCYTLWKVHILKQSTQNKSVVLTREWPVLGLNNVYRIGHWVILNEHSGGSLNVPQYSIKIKSRPWSLKWLYCRPGNKEISTFSPRANEQKTLQDSSNFPLHRTYEQCDQKTRLFCHL